jgi:hypothetical protein
LGKDPGGFQWWASILIPAIGAFASLGVLFFSVWTANKAREEVHASEQARRNDEAHRIASERRQRLTGRLADILDTIPGLLEEIRSERKESLETGRTFQRVPVSPLVLRVSAAMLEADEEERSMLQEFRALILGSTKIPELQNRVLGIAADLLVEWVHGTEDRKQQVLEAMRRVKERPKFVDAVRKEIWTRERSPEDPRFDETNAPA